VRADYVGGAIRLEIPGGVGILRVPASAMDLHGFTEWGLSSDFPDRGRISFLGNEVVIDMSSEEFETHSKVKAEIGAALHTLARDLDLGEFYSDGVLLKNEAAGLNHCPDGLFVSWETLRSGRVWLEPRHEDAGQYTHIEGCPD
jgi:hypothetical protein